MQRLHLDEGGHAYLHLSKVGNIPVHVRRQLELDMRLKINLMALPDVEEVGCEPCILLELLQRVSLHDYPDPRNERGALRAVATVMRKSSRVG